MISDENNKSVEKSEVAKKEEKILQFWLEKGIFEKSLAKNRHGKDFVFYDGPPFATGLPHYGHLIPSTLKDIVPRYKTMRGFNVERMWGWDCHGLPIENLIEKELGLNSKKEIEEYGIDKFNEKAEGSVLRYEKEWKELIPRVGRWVDMEDDYKTMDASYTESIWWAFKTLYNKGLAYEGYKSMHICPRCETTLSNFEVNQGYKDITDISVTVKFELVDEPGTFLLAWTTTPWTLPGNVALAIGANIKYVAVKMRESGEHGERSGIFILAESRLEELSGEYEIVREISTEELIGKKYKPVFDYFYKNSNLKNHENGWKVYSADFVTTEDGTGIVHIAPAFGEDDMKLGQEKNLPFIQHVNTSGHFTEEVTDFAGVLVKPKDDHQATDIEIIKKLAHDGKLFAKKKIEHSYPHCWRCNTPLLNYAANSWFIDVIRIKENLLANNRATTWVPEGMRDGRFGNWLEGARDWAISRQRYWGAPLPVWKNEKTGEVVVIGSVSELKKYLKKSGNKYFLMRHGQSESNAKMIASCRKNDHGDSLTEIGVGEVNAQIEFARENKIDLIVTSPLNRTRESGNILAKALGIEIVEDYRLGEINMGALCGDDINKYNALSRDELRDAEQTHRMETWVEVKLRAMTALYELEKKYSGKNILIISHDATLRTMLSGIAGMSSEEMARNKSALPSFRNAEIRAVDFVPLPHNKDFEINLHRPNIDGVELFAEDGTRLHRIEDVFDCWFESGSMIYASLHYPFENVEKFNSRFPADFIAEGVDQTRGWFYSLMVLSTALFGKPAFKKVVVSGMVLAENGQKMSKSLRNYEPLEIALDSMGADAIRLFSVSSPVVHGEDVNFSPKIVNEYGNKVLGRLRNAVSLYELYKTDHSNLAKQSTNILDKWILARLEETLEEITENLEKYYFDKAIRPVFDFVEDFSNWYLRRSRDRMKAGNEDSILALETTRYVLEEIAKGLAPFTPFVAEEIYQAVKIGGAESVHLEVWPVSEKGFLAKLFGGKKHDKTILNNMEITRALVSLALEARASAGIKVRQPLRKLTIPGVNLSEEYKQLIAEEINVKEVVEDGSLARDKVILDLEIDEALQKEGILRDLIRAVQSLRKTMNLEPKDLADLYLKTDSLGTKFIEEFGSELKGATGIREIIFSANILDGERVEIAQYSFELQIGK